MIQLFLHVDPDFSADIKKYYASQTTSLTVNRKSEEELKLWVCFLEGSLQLLSTLAFESFDTVHQHDWY